jgi:hypothetical protein
MDPWDREIPYSIYPVHVEPVEHHTRKSLGVPVGRLCAAENISGNI